MRRFQIRKTSRAFRAVPRLVFMVVLLMASLCSLHGEEGRKALRPVTLQLKWKHQFQFAGYYAAVEKGFYRSSGLDVRLIEASENLNPALPVFDGRAEFGICTSDILLLRNQGKKAVLLATIFQHSPQVLVGSKKAGIENVHDLTGKRIAMEPNAADLLAFLEDEGITRDRYTMIAHEFNVNSLTEGKVDALSAYSTDEPFVLMEKGFEYSLITPAMGGIDFYGDVLFTSEEVIKKDPAMVMKFRQASLLGWEYALEHPEEIIDLILQKYSRRHSREHLEFEAFHMQKLIMKNVVELGYTNPERWKQILLIYQRLGLIDGNLNTDGLLYTDYISQPMKIPWRLILIFSSIIVLIGSAAWFFFNSARTMRLEVNRRKKVENELNQSNILFRSILKASPDGILLTDLGGHIRMSSPAALRLFGYASEEELLGKKIESLIDDVEQQRFRSMVQGIRDGQVPGPSEYQGKKHDGNFFDFEANAELIRHPGGETTGMVLVVRDIRERR